MTKSSISQTDAPKSAVAGTQIVERNIRALIAKRQAEEKQLSLQDRLADGITHFAGSMKFIYLHLLAYGAWIVINLGWSPLRPFDPSFVKLAMIASVEAIFLSTFVLISQNHMAAVSDKHADLNLHVSLLAEHEVTRLIQLVTAIAERMDIDIARDPELSELSKDVLPEEVLQEMEENQNELNDSP